MLSKGLGPGIIDFWSPSPPLHGAYLFFYHPLQNKIGKNWLKSFWEVVNACWKNMLPGRVFTRSMISLTMDPSGSQSILLSANTAGLSKRCRLYNSTSFVKKKAKIYHQNVQNLDLDLNWMTFSKYLGSTSKFMRPVTVERFYLLYNETILVSECKALNWVENPKWF